MSKGKAHFTLHGASRKAFAARLRSCLEERGSTLRLSEKIGASSSAVRQWKAAKTEPSRDYLVATAEALTVSIEWLATGTPQTTRDCELQLEIDEAVFSRLRERESGAENVDELNKIKEEIISFQKYLANSHELLMLLRHQDKLKGVTPHSPNDLKKVPQVNNLPTTVADRQPPITIDQKLMGRCSDAFGKLYKELGVSLSLDDLGQLAAEAYNDVVITTQNPDEQRIVIKGLASRHRREILTETTANTSGKRTAL